MADFLEDTLPDEEREFQKTIALIGGKERIYLVGDAGKSKEVDGDDSGILQEFISDMFYYSNGEPQNSPSGMQDNTARRKGTHETRQNRHTSSGWINTHRRGERRDTSVCATLERLIRSVFHKHLPETIWVGCFIPKTEARILSIKKNACKVIYSSQTADNTRDRGNPLLWPFQCLFGDHRRGQANNSSNGRQRGNTGSKEEGIPLKTISLSAGPHVDVGDS
ncbi:hypothetical protein PBY51_024495 [Eleginops maclovinus]|uniref:Uncharacterized protein n=1 Tax=Eleginops maclovinus TaxID=56733 RepID=A0AAN7XZK0_ELEMC|nr:hypothetical protein PBY51_024495 [Eleginops maclovinus]